MTRLDPLRAGAYINLGAVLNLLDELDDLRRRFLDATGGEPGKSRVGRSIAITASVAMHGADGSATIASRFLRNQAAEKALTEIPKGHRVHREDLRLQFSVFSVASLFDLHFRFS